MSFLKKLTSSIGDLASSILGDASKAVIRTTPATKGITDYQKRKKEQAEKEAISEKAAARAKIVPLPDIDVARTEQRKRIARKNKARGGRSSTILSSPDDTLG